MDRRTELRQIFESEETFATTMVVALTDALESIEWLNWEPEAVELEIRSLCNAQIPKTNMDKIMALALAMTTNQFYVSLEAFMFICNALAGDGADFRLFDPADVEEMCWAVTEVLINDEPHELPLEQVFSQEIRHYIGVTAGYEGFNELPKPLTFGELASRYDAATENMPDEAMFGAFFSRSKQAVADAEEETRQKYEKLMQQISHLPLRHADHESWKKFAGKELSQTGTPRLRAEEGRQTRERL